MSDNGEQAIRLVADGIDAMSRQVGRVLPTLGYRVALPRAQYRRVMVTIDALYNDVACRLFPDGDDDATRLIFPGEDDT